MTTWAQSLAAMSGKAEALILELLVERASFLEYSGGFDRDEAERLARLDVEAEVLR